MTVTGVCRTENIDSQADLIRPLVNATLFLDVFFSKTELTENIVIRKFSIFRHNCINTNCSRENTTKTVNFNSKCSQFKNANCNTNKIIHILYFLPHKKYVI